MSTKLDKIKWAHDFAARIGNLHPLDNILFFIMGWEAHESGQADSVGCDYNPLNVAGHNAGEPQPCGHCNAIVNNYCSYEDGLQASAKRLKGALYPSLAHALITNDENNLGFNNHPMAHNVAGDLTMWVHGYREPIATDYIKAIMGNAVSISGGPGSKDVPDQPQGIDALTAIGNVFTTLSNLMSNPTRLAKGAIGLVLVIVGITMMVKQLVPPEVSKAVKLAAMA